MNNNIQRALKYVRRGFFVPDAAIPTRVFVEWDGNANRFVAGVEKLDVDTMLWVEQPGKQVMNSEKSMWEMAEKLWEKEGGP